MQEKGAAAAAVDRFSILPADILHKIMLHCSTADAAKTASLSKRWKSLWDRFPRLDLDEDRYQDLDQFVEAMEVCLINHEMDHVRELTIQTFSCLTEHDMAIEVINTVVYVAATQGCLQKVQLNFENDISPYDITLDDYVGFPQVLFTHGLFLKSLNIVGCRFEPSYLIISLPLLTTLEIMDACIMDHNLLQHLLHSCPSLQHFSVAFLRGLESIQISHQELLSLKIWAWEELEKILGLDLPMLQSFTYIGWRPTNSSIIDSNVMTKLSMYRIVKLTCHNIDIHILEFLKLKFKQLERLEFRSNAFKGEGDEKLCIASSSYPCLKEVIILHCQGAKDIRVLCSTVERAVIHGWTDIEKCLILAPCLKTFEYEGPAMKLSLTGRNSVPELIFDSVQGNDVLQLVQDRDLIHSSRGNRLGEMKLTMLHNDSLV